MWLTVDVDVLCSNRLETSDSDDVLCCNVEQDAPVVVAPVPAAGVVAGTCSSARHLPVAVLLRR